MFCVKPKNSDAHLLPVRQVNAIFLSKGVGVSTNALMLAIENQIPVVLIDGIDRPKGIIWTQAYGSIVTIRKKQALFAQHPRGFDWVRQQLLRKIAAQYGVLQEIRQSPLWQQADFANEYQKADRVINSVSEQLAAWSPPDNAADFEQQAPMLRGWEGNASRHYFRTIAHCLPTAFYFDKRSRHPAFDAFNALLNYLYGMLYVMVEMALVKAGIDPYMGILHADEYQKITMVYDCIEPYRPWADITAIELCQQNRINPDAFVEIEGEGVRLTTQKNIVVSAFLDFLNQKTMYNGRQMRRNLQIDLNAQLLATQMRNFDSTDT